MRCILQLLTILCLTFVGCTSVVHERETTLFQPTVQSFPSNDDPFLWLENIEGPKALSWVNERNHETLGQFQADRRYPAFLEKAETILNATDRIPYGTVRGGNVYNFWQDATHIRGLWRRCSLKSYRTEAPEWEILLDFDALAKTENENWVYKGVTCLAPEFNRCLLRLSRGGKDASVYREFNLATKSFVEGGFVIPEAKSDAEWVDQDTLLVGTNWGEGTLTASGYPRLVKLWKRGQDLSEAQLVMEGLEDDIGVWPGVLDDGNSRFSMIIRSLTFFTAEYYLIGREGKLVKVPIQESAELKGFYKGHVLLSLREPWTTNDISYPQGALLAFSGPKLAETGKLPTVQLVYAPDAQTSIQGVSESKSGLFVSLIENVKGRVLHFDIDNSGAWKSSPVALPATGSISIASATPFDETVFFNYEDHITPDRLFEYNVDKSKPKVLKELPRRFDTSGLEVHQYFVKSKDGEDIPYFVIHRKNIPLTNSTPTVLYGYGGFEISLTPRYSAAAGKLWLERGGAYAIANIRGGGEYGPRWHKAALREKRQRAYDDFIAVAEDLINRKITSSKHLGIMGGSNGGLLVGVALTQRPDLFNAVVCQVPLLDMYRYTKMLAGSSWEAEYGDPEKPEMWKVIGRYSPYHNLRIGVTYPRAFLLTSTKDDRVHPGHARKMVAKMMQQGHPVYYYENTEGGHAAGANLKQHAKRYALEYVYLSRQLGLN